MFPGCMDHRYYCLSRQCRECYDLCRHANRPTGAREYKVKSPGRGRGSRDGRTLRAAATRGPRFTEFSLLASVDGSEQYRTIRLARAVQPNRGAHISSHLRFVYTLSYRRVRVPLMVPLELSRVSARCKAQVGVHDRGVALVTGGLNPQLSDWVHIVEAVLSPFGGRSIRDEDAEGRAP